MTQPTPLSDKQRFWLEHLQACEHSGLTMKAYAQANELSADSFYAWKSTLRRKGVVASAPAEASALFAEARVLDERRGALRARLPGGTVLEFDAGTDPRWVAQLVRALLA